MSQEHTAPPTELETRVKALESLLVEKERTSTDAIEAIVQTYERDVGPHLGARVIARAWMDREFRQRLLDDGTSAITELGFGGAQTEVLVVKENTPTVHNVVVCTLCSCYPWAVLGLPPTWYKSPAYRSRVVREPREVLGEFGVELDDDVEIRVWDSTSEVRYLILPQRPAGTQGWSEDRLAELVTRDAMIGVGTVRVV